VASINSVEEECGFWECPSLEQFKVPARVPAPKVTQQQSQSQPHRQLPPPRARPTTATPSRHMRAASEPEHTTELFPEATDPTAELFPA